MISGLHSVIFSKDPEADREFMKNVLKLTHVDVGGGWLIFGLPPSEIAVHPSDKDSIHELYLMCDDINQFAHKMAENSISISEVTDEGWGLLASITLPGGGALGVYQPRHERPEPM